MPSDLYNLNSAYGSVEDLKDCIKEMHSQDLLVHFSFTLLVIEALNFINSVKLAILYWL